MTSSTHAATILICIKLLHTAVWLFFASCIVALPFVARARRFRWAAILSALVLAECAVLALNHFRCPLTDLAAHYTNDRAVNFDIYLPAWMARHNKPVSGTLFVLAEVFVVWQVWLMRRESVPTDAFSHKLHQIGSHILRRSESEERTPLHRL